MIGWFNVFAAVALLTCSVAAVLWWVETDDDGES